jgi:hypothetical protein
MDLVAGAEAEVEGIAVAAVVLGGEDGYINLPSPSQEYMYGK